MTIEQSWQNILSLTQAMEQQAAEQNWEVVAEQAAERHNVIQQHFQQFSVGPDTAEFYYHRLSQFLQQENQLQQLAANAKKQVLKQNLNIINNKKAAGAYRLSKAL